MKQLTRDFSAWEEEGGGTKTVFRFLNGESEVEDGLKKNHCSNTDGESELEDGTKNISLSQHGRVNRSCQKQSPPSTIFGGGGGGRTSNYSLTRLWEGGRTGLDWTKAAFDVFMGGREETTKTTRVCNNGVVRDGTKTFLAMSTWKRRRTKRPFHTQYKREGRESKGFSNSQHGREGEETKKSLPFWVEMRGVD